MLVQLINPSNQVKFIEYLRYHICDNNSLLIKKKFYNSDLQIAGTVESYMYLEYDDCNDECFKNLQNITFCVDETPKSLKPAFANEQTTDMIKILIGKYCAIFFSK